MEIRVSDGITISESFGFTKESHYLLFSSRDHCKRILAHPKREEGDRIDFQLYLHRVLEIGIHSLFRQLTYLGTTFQDRFLRVQEMDAISFIHKTAMLIHLWRFKIEGEDDQKKALEYAQVARKMRAFSEVRNKLEHGHAIVEYVAYDGEGNVTDKAETKATDFTTEESMQRQIELFRQITEAVSFYIKRLPHLSEQGKDDLCKEFLGSSFLD